MGIVRVKICGLTRVEDVNNALDCGADAVGFIFGYRDSPRNISYEKLAELVRSVPPYVSSVVVSPSSNAQLTKVVSEIGPSYLQLYSKEPRTSGVISANVIETIHVGSDNAALISQCEDLSKSCKALLLDSGVAGRNGNGSSVAAGGTGVIHDWSLSRRVREALFPFPLILAGGLNARNVADAIHTVRPFAVDVSSGVEAKPGIKDKTKVREFIQNAKSA